MHTVVKIEQHLNGDQTVHLLDASRSVTVVERLLGDRKEEYENDIKKEFEELREMHGRKKSVKSMHPISVALRIKLKIE